LMPESWRGERVFCNPPYDATALQLAIECANSRQAEMSVLLLPPNFDTKWARSMWPDEIPDYPYLLDAAAQWNDHWLSLLFPTQGWELRLWNGRIRFGRPKRLIQTFVNGVPLVVPDETDPETDEGPAPRAGNMIAIWHE